MFTDISNADAVRFCDFCHAHNPPIAFIKAETRGLFASAFCDFGPSFTVTDTDGERPWLSLLDSPAVGRPGN